MPADCANCPLAVNGRPERAAQPICPSKPKLVILGDQPRVNESQKEFAFDGNSRRIVETVAKRNGILPRQIWMDNAIACWSADATRSQLLKAAECCADRVSLPQGVPTVTMGEYAFHAATQARSHIKYANTVLRPGLVPTVGINYIHAKPAYQDVLSEAIGAALKGAPRKWGTHIIRDGKEMREALRVLRNASELAVDIETAGSDPLFDPILCIGVGTDELVVSVPWQVDGGEEVWASDSTQELLREVLAAPSLKTAHNGAHDFLGLEAAGLDVGGDRFDTLLAHAVVAPELLHNLQFVAATAFPVEPWKKDFVSSADPDLKGAEVFSQRDQYDLRAYNCKDVEATAALVEPLRIQLALTHKGNEHYARLQRLSDIAMKMQQRGMPVDLDQFYEVRNFVDSQIELFRTQWNELYPGTDLGSEGTTGAVKNLFFKRLNAPVYSRTDTGAPSLGKDALTRMAAEHRGKELGDAARLLLKIKAFGKMRGTFLKLRGDDDSGRGLVLRDGWVQPTWKVFGTISRRFSCSDPNIQQAPKDLRTVFHCPPGFVFVEADYSQLEPRIMAELSRDPKLVQVYRDGLDLYKQVASAVFTKDYADVTKSERQISKMVWLAAGYGTGAETLAEQMAARGIPVSLPQASLFLRRLKEGFPGLNMWQMEVIRRAEKDLYVEEPFTEWRRHFQDKCVEHPKCKNFAMQAGGAAIMNDVLMDLDDALNWKDEWLVAQIHDAITLIVPEDRAEEWCKRLESLMYRNLGAVELKAEAIANREWLMVKD